jgi:hypothetical protein
MSEMRAKGFGYFGGEQCVIYEHIKRKKYFQILENLKNMPLSIHS